MIPNARPAWFALLVLALAGIGCEQLRDNNPTGANLKPEVSSAPAAPPAAQTAPAPEAPKDQPKPAAAPEKKEGPGASTAPAVTPRDLTASAPQDEPAPASSGAVKLEKVKFDEFLKRVANKDAKYTMVDCWATWCGPCKENFPHVVAMNEKYAGKGLAVASLSFDDPSSPQQLKDAEAFLHEKHATFTNYVLDEPDLGGFEKFNINGIPAVFLYGPDGKEVKRFTMDDPNNQFTYDEVEDTVVALLDGKPLPRKETAKPAQGKDQPSQ